MFANQLKMRNLFIILLTLVTSVAYSDIRYEGSADDVVIAVDGKAYTYGTATITRRVEGNEHITTFTWNDGYCLEHSHYHDSGEKQTRQRAVTPPAPVRESAPVIVAVRSSSPQPQASSEVSPMPDPDPVVEVVSAPLQPLRVTEYMVRDWSRYNSNLPQWIELSNPNTEDVNLKGYTFQYATRPFANSPYTIHTLTLASAEDDTDGFVVAGEGVAVLVTHDVLSRRFSGIEVSSQVYDLDIENVLKRGWVLTDADGREVQRLGRDAFRALRDPVAPRHQDNVRVSYQGVPSESPIEAYYYGHREDIGSPGFYKQPVPKAPSAIRRKRVGTWASLKEHTH